MQQLPGQRHLEEIVTTSSQNEVAAKVNVKQQAISRWILGSTIPNAFYQQVLEKAFGIRREEWLTPVQALALQALERDVERQKVEKLNGRLPGRARSRAPSRRHAR